MKNKKAIYLLLTILSMFGFYYVLGNNIKSIFIFLFPVIYVIINKNIDTTKLSLIYSIISSIIYIVGKEIYETHNLNNIINSPLKYSLYILGMIIIFYIFYELIRQLYEKYNNKKKRVEEITKKEKIIGLLIMICTHLICYISYFPGIYTYDIPYQLEMIKGNTPLSNFHPILHTLIIKLFYQIEAILKVKDIGIVFYTIFQVTIVIWAYISILKWFYKHNFSKKFIIASYLYYTFNPLLLVFSLCTTKDIYFGVFLSLFITTIYDLYHNNTGKNKIKYIILGIGTCLFRNNMIYVIIVFFIFLIITMKKEFPIKTAYILLVYYIFQSFILPIMGVKPTLMQEKMSIPLSQMSYIYLYEDTYTGIEKQIIKSYVPYIDKYNPRFADGVKYAFNETKYNEDSNTFIKLYLKGLIEHPIDYLCVFLDMNVVYWYPNSKPIDQYSSRVYIEDDSYNRRIKGKYQENETILKNTYKLFHSFSAYDNPIQKLPIISIYFLLSFSFIFMILYSYILFLNPKDKSLIYIFIVLILLFSTYLLGPVSNYRYVYPYYLCFPILLGLLLYREKKEGK